MDIRTWNLGDLAERIRFHRWRIIERSRRAETFHIKLSPCTAIDTRAKCYVITRNGTAHALMPAAEYIAEKTDPLSESIVISPYQRIRDQFLIEYCLHKPGPPHDPFGIALARYLKNECRGKFLHPFRCFSNPKSLSVYKTTFRSRTFVLHL